MTNTTATIKENVKINDAMYRMVLDCPDIDLSKFIPGQFADIEVPGHPEMLLKRPFSIHAADAAAHTVTLIYQIAGRGTDALSHAKCGLTLAAILPIGTGFNLQDSDKNVILVGGGAGVAPLLSVVRRWPGRQYRAYLGFRSKDYAYCIDAFESECSSARVSSDDGTVGIHGVITDIVEADVATERPDIVLACGPTPMLKALKGILSPRSIRAQFSLEQRMACGFGACATCACGIDNGDGLEYKKVCINGPVFDMDEVVL